MKRNAFLLVCVLTALVASQQSFAEFDDGTSAFSITVNNEIYPYREFAIYVLPYEQLGICINADNSDDYTVKAENGILLHLGDCRWSWTAPASTGMTRLKIANEVNEDRMLLNVFVMTPAAKMKNGVLDDVTIGKYPPPIDNSPLYQKPDGFIKVSEDMLATSLSPHFVLGQFITPSGSAYPKYIVLRERLLLKLEALVTRLNELGYTTSSLSIISGYMTPHYNASIGGQEYSRHLYGGAATVVIDNDADGKMDDLDKNGTIDTADAEILFNIIDKLYGEPGKEYLRGGLYLYTASTRHGPSVMLDARGYRKRWDKENALPGLPDNLKPKHKRSFINK